MPRTATDSPPLETPPLVAARTTLDQTEGRRAPGLRAGSSLLAASGKP